MIRVGILGARGYTGGELIRLLLNHNKVEITYLGSSEEAGEPITNYFPELRNRIDLKLEKIDLNEINSRTDFVFLALPHKVSQKYAPELIKMGKKIVDLSADFRFRNVETYEKYYKIPHIAKELNAEVPYGLPELFKNEIINAKMVANPGCYTTAGILSFAPLMKSDFVDKHSIIIDAKSGVSGAGRKYVRNYHFVECNESVKAYSVPIHRHRPEIEENLSILANENIRISFIPHLIPINRGILSTGYINLTKNILINEVHKVYEDFYKETPFVRILPSGKFPSTNGVMYTNFCDIGIAIDKFNSSTQFPSREGLGACNSNISGRIIIISAIDNLIKGASGQAIQNMNLMCGFNETEGLL